MHALISVPPWTAYAGMQLRDTACDVFIDNPLFSEIIFDNPLNPGMAKTWGRFVRQSGQPNQCFVPAELGTEQDYAVLEAMSQRRGHRSFDALWGGWRSVTADEARPWLICEPREEILQYWYNRSLSSWRHEIATALLDLGHDWEFRPKPARRHRANNLVPRVLHVAANYRGVITAHSVSAIDSLLAGRPSVIWGQDPTLGCGTPWTEFVATGQAREPSLTQIQIAACTWAATTHRTLETERAIRCIMK